MRLHPKHKAKGLQNASVYSDKFVRDISEAVYRARLGEKEVLHMMKHVPNAADVIRSRANIYDKLTRTYLNILQIKEPKQ